MRYSAAIAAFLLAASSVSALAHDEFRVVGVVTKVNQNSLSVKQTGGVEHVIKLDRQTAVLRDGKKAVLADLKAGQTTVVNALGDTMEDMLAIEIRIVPPVK